MYNLIIRTVDQRCTTLQKTMWKSHCNCWSRARSAPACLEFKKAKNETPFWFNCVQTSNQVPVSPHSQGYLGYNNQANEHHNERNSTDAQPSSKHKSTTKYNKRLKDGNITSITSTTSLLLTKCVCSGFHLGLLPLCTVQKARKQRPHPGLQFPNPTNKC